MLEYTHPLPSVSEILKPQLPYKIEEVNVTLTGKELGWVVDFVLILHQIVEFNVDFKFMIMGYSVNHIW